MRLEFYHQPHKPLSSVELQASPKQIGQLGTITSRTYLHHWDTSKMLSKLIMAVVAAALIIATPYTFPGIAIGNAARNQVPGVYSFKLGDFTITARERCYSTAGSA